MVSQSPGTSAQPLFSITEFCQICRLFLVELFQCLKDPGVLGPNLGVLGHHYLALLLGLELKVTHFVPELNDPELIFVCAGLGLLQLLNCSVEILLLTLASPGPLIFSLGQSLSLLFDYNILVSQ